MNLMTNNCEIVDNTACGQTFQYCRTHKVEPKDCPSNKKPLINYNTDMLHAFQCAISAAAAPAVAVAPKREFEVGDRVYWNGQVRTIVEGDQNFVGKSREAYEAEWGPAVLCDNGFFYRESEVRHV